MDIVCTTNAKKNLCYYERLLAVVFALFNLTFSVFCMDYFIFFFNLTCVDPDVSVCHIVLHCEIKCL